MNQKDKIGILAYGSLIDDPGEEIAAHMIGQIDCVTPFNVEYARMSKTRDNAPTLIPVAEEGRPVIARVLILEHVSYQEAEDMLWRRETRQKDRRKRYPNKSNPSSNDVVVKSVENFHGLEKVLYTSIGQNIGVPSPHLLAKLAIESYYAGAGDIGKDGISYLLQAKKNGIRTALSDEYEMAILKATNSKDLQDAIGVLAKEKPHILHLQKQKREFEIKYREIGDLIHNYGLTKTLQGRTVEPKDFKAFLETHRNEFMINVHEGFKIGQEKILMLLLDFENQKDSLLTEKAKLKGKEKQREKEKLTTQINLIEYWGHLLRHMIDSIGWQLLKGQLYASRQIYQGVKGTKKLKESNIESVASVVRELNKVPEDFALITDLSGYLQIGDIMWLSKEGLRFVEVKEGEKNHQVLEVIDRMMKAEKPSPEVLKGIKVDRHFIQQLDRNLKQFDTAKKVVDILNMDKGVDKKGRDVKIITPKETTPRFDERMHKLEDQLKTRNLWAYDVIDECLHVGLYKGPMKLIGPRILMGIATHGNFAYVLANYRSVIRSLNRPIFSLPFSPELIYDILFDRVDLIFMIDLDGYIRIFDHFGLTARWQSRKETAKLLEQHKGEQIFVHKHRCICIEDKEKTKTMYLSLGILQRMYFEFILPSYTAYITLYYFDVDAEHSNHNEGAT